MRVLIRNRETLKNCENSPLNLYSCTAALARFRCTSSSNQHQATGRAMYDMSDEAAACLQEAVDTTTRRLYSYTFRIERHEGGGGAYSTRYGFLSSLPLYSTFTEESDLLLRPTQHIAFVLISPPQPFCSWRTEGVVVVRY